MAQPSSRPHDLFPHQLRPDSDHQVLPFPTRFATYVTADVPAPSAGGPATRPRAQVRTRVIRQVVVLGTAGRLSDVVVDLDRAMQLALADEPPGVVCDLSAVREGVERAAVEVLATAGRHVRDWPGIPVGVACPDPQVREALRAHPLGRYLIVSESLFSAISAVLATPAPTVARLRLAPHPTAPRASRNFVTRALLDWRLNRVVPFASLVVSELVASSSINVGTEIDLSVAWSLGALRLAVRDRGPALPDQLPPGCDLHGRGLTVVAGLTRAFGMMPTANGGRVVWAVLDAPRRLQPSDRPRPADERAEATIRNTERALPRPHSGQIIEGGLR